MVVRADWLKAFQSTLPLRGATSTTEGSRQWLTDFNPHSPCGERPATSETNKLTAQFQSTLPLRGATRHRMTMMVPTVFQSTLPLRGATLQVCDFWGTARMISIHTPLAGSDSDFQRKLSGETISIHTPLAGSDVLAWPARVHRSISIHTPLAGSDITLDWDIAQREISIHTPLAGSDRSCRRRAGRRVYFNPHSPCGERPQK